MKLCGVIHALALTLAINAAPAVFEAKASAGTTKAEVRATKTMLSGKPGEEKTFSLGGYLRVRSGARLILDISPWTLAFDFSAKDLAAAEGFTDVELSALHVAQLSGSTPAEVLLFALGCGANCSSSAHVLTFDPRTFKYVLARPIYAEGWDPVAQGKVIHLAPAIDGIATTQLSPFRACHACLPGSVPVLYRVSGTQLVDTMSRYRPMELRKDAVDAWREFLATNAKWSQEEVREDAQDALFRYIADEARLGNVRLALIQAYRAYRHNDSADFFERTRKALRDDGYVR